MKIKYLLLLLPMFVCMQLFGQATLPVSRTVWNAGEPTGWTNSGSTARTSNFACSGSNGALFDDSNDRRTVFFNAAPNQLTFKLKRASMSGASSLLVERSDDGASWTSIGTYGTATGATPITDCADITLSLTSGTRYVRWTYTKGTGNCDFDDVSISAAVAGPTISTSSITGAPFCVGNGVTASVSVPYTITGTYTTGNIFTAELSNASGSFASGTTTIGTANATTAGTISATIPASVAASTAYRIRVTASAPSTTGTDNGTNFAIQNFAGPTATAASCGNTNASISWTNPGCFDQIMVVAKSSTFSSTLPTGDGSAYTANLTFGSGTAFDGGSIVYKGTATASGTITGLTNGTTYYYKTFARRGTTWVAGATDNCTPAVGPCFTEDFETGLPTAYTSATSYTLSSGIWTGQANGVVRGTAGVNSGSYSVQLRSQTGAQITSPNLTNGIAVLSYYVSASTTGSYQVNISTDNGATFSPAPGSPFSANTTTTLNTININNASVTNIQFYRTGATIYIDNITWTCPPACTPPADPIGSINGTTPACGSTSLTFTGTATAPVVNYWQTSATGTLTSFNAGSARTVTASGSYFVRAYNSSTNCWSASAIGPYSVTINNNVNITAQPANRTVLDGNNTTFAVTATNAASYQWQVNTGSGFSNITNGGIYSGATTPTLSITGATSTLNGYQYRVVITGNSPCTGATSNAATLTVLPAVAVTDNGCVNDDYATMTFNVSSNLVITDINIGVKVTTTWRGDLIIKVVSPEGTEITIMNSVGDDWYDLDALFDDSGTANALSSGDHTVDGTYDVTTQVQGALTDALSTFNGELSQGTWTLKVCDAEDQDLAFINGFEVFVSGTTPCTPLANITSFAPTSGPAGTLVTITGTGFTGATGVRFNGVNAASFTVVNSTTIKAKVPTTGTTGKISVLDANNCATKTSTNFTLISESGTCGNGTTATELFISEIYDATTGDYHLVEIFNGTASSVNLSSYTVRVIAYGNNGSSTIDIPLSGTLASGAVYVVRIGNSSGPCGVTANLTNASGGFNGNDEVMLRKNGSTIDFTENPNSGAGFSQIRRASVTAPNTNYTPSEWNILATELCDDLGTSPYAAGTQLSITSNPKDSTGCTINMVVAATSNAGITYQWKYNDGATSGWTNVTTFLGTTVSGANSSALRIVGSVAGLSGYQFYCEVTAGSCTKYSQAAQFTYGVVPVFRSTGSGNWTNTAIWEMATTITGPFTPACEYPTASNTTEVVILSSHKVTLNTSLSIDKLTVNSGGELELTGSNTLTVLNSIAGADMVINGTLTDRCNSGGGIDFENNTGTINDATWSLGAAGSIVKTNTSSVINYRDFYQGGISTIPATSNWYYRYNGDGNPNTASVDMFYPNLYFENTANTGNFAWNTFSMILSGKNGFTTVKGDLNLGVTGQGTVTVINNNFNAQPMLVIGDLYIENGSTLTTDCNQALSPANYDLTYKEGTGFEVRGAIYVEGTLDANSLSSGVLRFSGTGTQDVLGNGTLDLWNLEKTTTGTVLLDRAIAVNNDISFSGGTFNAAGNNINVGGIWNNTGATYTHGNNTVIFNGSGNSTVRSNNQPFYNVQVSTTGAGKVYPVTNNMTVANLLSVTQGAFEVPALRTVTALQFNQSVGGTTTIKASGTFNVD